MTDLYPKRVYLAGPMSGYPELNMPEFRRVTAILRDAGFDVVDPCEWQDVDSPPTRAEAMRQDIPALLSCDGLVLLKGWSESLGANLEVFTAYQLSQPVYRFVDSEDGAFELHPVDTTPTKLPYATQDPKLFRNALEAAAAYINGARRSSYGHPLDDFARITGSINVFFKHKFKDGEGFCAEDWPLIMELVKISRQVECHKYDNIIDGAGYWGTLEMVVDERARRANQEYEEDGSTFSREADTEAEDKDRSCDSCQRCSI